MRRRHAPPAWSFVSASLLKALPVTPGVEFLTIVCDHDRDGIAANREAGSRWRRAGRSVRVLYPIIPGTDWADVAREMRA